MAQKSKKLKYYFFRDINQVIRLLIISVTLLPLVSSSLLWPIKPCIREKT